MDEVELPEEYEKLDYLSISNGEKKLIDINKITIDYNIPYLYRYMEKEYIEDFFSNGNFLISNFDRCKTLENQKRKDEEEGINHFNGTCEDYRIEMKLGINDNPFLICTSLFGPNKENRQCIKIKHPVEFIKCVCNKLREEGYIVTQIKHGPCFYTNKKFNGEVSKENIDEILKAKNGFDFSVFLNMEQEINNNSDLLYFNKPISFKEEQEYRIIFQYINKKPIPDPFIINIKEATQYCEMEEYIDK